MRNGGDDLNVLTTTKKNRFFFHIYSLEIEYLQSTVQILTNNDRLRTPELSSNKTPRLSGFASE